MTSFEAQADGASTDSLLNQIFEAEKNNGPETR